MTLGDLNSSSSYNEDVISEITIHAKIVGLLVYFLGCLGTFSIIGIINYEKFGQDPQKRSFADQIFAFNCKIFMILYPIFHIGKFEFKKCILGISSVIASTNLRDLFSDPT